MRFFAFEDLLNQRLAADEFGIGLAHFRHQCRHQSVHQRFARPEKVGVTHRAAHYSAKNITAPFVGWQYAVGHKEACRTQVIGDDAVAGCPVPFGLYACQAFARSDQVPECVCVVIVMHALHHGCDTFDPHAGVDAGLWQVGENLVVFLRVLHENEVPYLHEPVAVFLGRSRRAAPDVIAMIVKYLRAGTAWSIGTHGPEIILGRNADDLFVRKSGPFLPQIECLVVGMVDGDQKAFGVEAPFLGEKGPGVIDRLFLEIVPETEVSEHLEEGMMARRVADIIEIVVLAACSHAFLSTGCALRRWRFQTREGILERDHARIDEHERWIAERDKRGAGDFRMFVGGEIVEKAAADVVGRSHGEASKQSRGMRQA